MGKEVQTMRRVDIEVLEAGHARNLSRQSNQMTAVQPQFPDFLQLPNASGQRHDLLSLRTVKTGKRL